MPSACCLLLERSEPTRRETKAEREAWTAHIENRTGGRAVPRPSKYGAVRTEGYASKHEAEVARNLRLLASRGKIRNFQEQVRIELVPGKGKLRPIVYVADFVYYGLCGIRHVVDAKGFRTDVYRLKKRLAALLLGITIEEV